jgi:hypothetical protein
VKNNLSIEMILSSRPDPEIAQTTPGKIPIEAPTADRYILTIQSMSSSTQSPVTLALKILSPQYRRATGEIVTEADVDEIRNWAGDSEKRMSAWDAACVVIRRELARERSVQ